MAEIALIDTTMRDGNQSLWGATGLNTAMMATIAPIIDRVGFSAVDFITSTHMAVAVRYLKENPWERIRVMRTLMPHTPLSFLTTGMRFISWEMASAELMQLAFSLLVRDGIRRFAVMDPMNDAAAMIAVARALAQSRCAASCCGAVLHRQSPARRRLFCRQGGSARRIPRIRRALSQGPRRIADAGARAHADARAEDRHRRASVGTALALQHRPCAVLLSRGRRSRRRRGCMSPCGRWPTAPRSPRPNRSSPTCATSAMSSTSTTRRWLR